MIHSEITKGQRVIIESSAIGKKNLSPVDLYNGEAEREVLEELRSLNPAELSPMMAFNRICEWNSKLKK